MNLQIYIPYVAVDTKAVLKFEKLQDILKTEPIASDLFFMTFILEEISHKKQLTLSLTFPATVKDGYKFFSPTYMYKWNKKYITIKRLIGTTDTKVIKSLAEELLQESYRFYFMYCSYTAPDVVEIQL